MKKLVFSFGRFNPPTTGHEVLLKKVVAVAKKENADAMVYSSQSNDPKKNPLPYKEKTKFMKAMFPKHKKVIQYDVGVKNAFDTLSTVYAKGYRDVTMVVGSDRVTEFEKILNKYNDVKGKHGYYNFEGGVKVVSAGARDPDAEGVTGMSASKMRAAAAANDFESFAKGMPAGFKGGQSVFDAVRNGMNLSEEMMDFLGSDIKEFRTFINADIIEMLDDIDDEELFESIDEDFGAIPDFATMVAFGMAAKMSFDAVKMLVRTVRGVNKVRKWAKRSGNKLRDTVNPAPNFTQFESTGQNGLIGLDQIKKFESVVDKLFAKYDIDFNFTRHFGDRMDDSRNSPSITLKELAEFIKKMYKRQGKSIKGVAGAEAVLKDIQSDLNIPVAVTYDSNNDEFDVVLKTIMRKKNFTSPDKVIKYEENDMTNKLPEGFMDTIKQLVPGAKGKPAKKLQKKVKKSDNAEQTKIATEINRKLKLVDGLMKKVGPLGGQLGRLMAFRRLPIAKMTPKGMYIALNDWYHSVEDELDYGDDSDALKKKYGRSVEDLYELWEEVGFKLSDYMWASGYDIKGIGQMAKIGFPAKKRTDPEWLKMNESVELDESVYDKKLTQAWKKVKSVPNIREISNSGQNHAKKLSALLKGSPDKLTFEKLELALGTYETHAYKAAEDKKNPHGKEDLPKLEEFSSSVDDVIGAMKNLHQSQLSAESVSEGGLWDNINAKKNRIKNGSKEKMRKPNSKGAPTDKAIKDSQEEMDCWDGYKKDGKKPGTGKNTGKMVNNCVPEETDNQKFYKKLFGDK